MFERFTNEARRVIVLAQEQARLMRHPYIGTEHLLLGLLAFDNATSAALLAEGVTPDATSRFVEETRGLGGPGPDGSIPFTPRAKKVLELSLREALRLGHNFIASGHLLLGMLREGEGVGCQAMARLGADTARLTTAVESGLADFAATGGEDAVPPRSPADDVIEQLVEENRRLASEIERLREILRRNGIDET